MIQYLFLYQKTVAILSLIDREWYFVPFYIHNYGGSVDWMARKMFRRTRSHIMFV